MFLCGTDCVNQHFPEDGWPLWESWELWNLGRRSAAVGEVDLVCRGEEMEDREGPMSLVISRALVSAVPKAHPLPCLSHFNKSPFLFKSL